MIKDKLLFLSLKYDIKLKFELKVKFSVKL